MQTWYYRSPLHCTIYNSDHSPSILRCWLGLDVAGRGCPWLAGCHWCRPPARAPTPWSHARPWHYPHCLPAPSWAPPGAHTSDCIQTWTRATLRPPAAAPPFLGPGWPAATRCPGCPAGQCSQQLHYESSTIFTSIFSLFGEGYSDSAFLLTLPTGTNLIFKHKSLHLIIGMLFYKTLLNQQFS